MWTQSEVVGNIVQSPYAKNCTISHKFNNMNTFSNKLTSKTKDSVRLFFENTNSLLVNITYSLTS